MSLYDIDTHKLSYHPERIAKWKETGFCYPLHVEIGLTNRCNHNCTHCTLDWINHKQDTLNSTILIKTLQDFVDIGVKSIYFAGEGEPTLHEDLGKFSQIAYNLGLKVAVSTNGSYLHTLETSLPYLSWLRFSLDASTKDSFSKIHGVSTNEFDKVISNIKQCVDIVKSNNYKVQIGIQTLLMQENIHEIEDIGILSKNIGVNNFQVKPAHCHPKSSYRKVDYLGLHEKIQQRLEKLNDTTFTSIVRTKSIERLYKERTYDECCAFNVYGLIDACGNVVPCNIFYGDENYKFGNIYENSFSDIWTSDRKKKVIEKITKLQHSKCGKYRCRLDVMNRYLERVKNPEINDEFI